MKIASKREQRELVHYAEREQLKTCIAGLKLRVSESRSDSEFKEVSEFSEFSAALCISLNSLNSLNSLMPSLAELLLSSCRFPLFCLSLQV